MNGYTLRRLQEQAKWPTGAPIQLPPEFCIFTKRLLYEKTRYKSSDCSAEAIRRSSDSLLFEKNIPNYCNLVAHARRGLMNSANSMGTCIDSNNFDTPYAALQLSCNMSRHMLPSAYTVLERGGGEKHTEGEVDVHLHQGG